MLIAQIKKSQFVADRYISGDSKQPFHFVWVPTLILRTGRAAIDSLVVKWNSR